MEVREKRMKRRSSEAGMTVEPVERHVFLTPPCHCGRVQTEHWSGGGSVMANIGQTRVGKNQQSGVLLNLAAHLQLQHTRKHSRY